MVRIGRDIVAAALTTAPSRSSPVPAIRATRPDARIGGTELSRRLRRAERHRSRPRTAHRHACGLRGPHAHRAELRRPAYARALRRGAGRGARFSPPRHHRGQLTLGDKPLFIYRARQAAGARRLRDGAAGARPAEDGFRGRLLATPSSTPTRRASSTSRCARASSTSRGRGRCRSSRPSRWPARWRRSPSPARWRCSMPRRWPASCWRSWCGRARRWSTARFTSNVDMKSGAPAFGTPEIRKARSGPASSPLHRPALARRRRPPPTCPTSSRSTSSCSRPGARSSAAST